jgi:hypothetical protein
MSSFPTRISPRGGEMSFFLTSSFIAKSSRRAGQGGKELRFLHGAIKCAVHARGQVGRNTNGASFGSPFYSMVPDSVLNSVMTTARHRVR